MARVLLGVTGGIAAYKACELTRLFVRGGHEVTPILTADAHRPARAGHFDAPPAPPAAPPPPAPPRPLSAAGCAGVAPPARGAAGALPAPGRGRPARGRAAVGEHAR